MKSRAQHYAAVCPKCQDTIRAFILSSKQWVPPPAIGGACGCDIPVASVSLIYQGTAVLNVEKPLVESFDQ